MNADMPSLLHAFKPPPFPPSAARMRRTVRSSQSHRRLDHITVTHSTSHPRLTPAATTLCSLHFICCAIFVHAAQALGLGTPAKLPWKGA